MFFFLDPCVVYNSLSQRVVHRCFPTFSNLIIGAGNFLGYHVARQLHRKQLDVVLVEDYVGIELDNSKQKWFYIDKLRKEKMPVKFYDLDSEKQFSDLLMYQKKPVGTVIYIVSASYQNVHLHDFYGVPNYSKHLASLTFLLDTMLANKDFKDTKLILMLDMKGDETLQKQAVEVFSLILLSYQKSYNCLDIAIVEVNTQSNRNCWPFKHFLNFLLIKSESTNAPSCVMLNPHETPRANKGKALHKLNNVLFSTYLTHDRKFFRFYRNDSFQFLKGFFMTAKKQNLKIVLYHDEASLHFQRKLRNYYGGIEFIHYSGNYDNRSINDARFYIMYEYLLDHPEIDGIVLQDLRDGVFYEDPFKVMGLLGDYFFNGVDYPFDRKRRKGYKRCEGKFGVEYGDIPRLYPFLNAGTIGGTRHMVLGFLTLAVHFFEKLMPASHNCNMDLIDFVAHRYMYDTLFTGYPFQCSLGIDLASPPGTAIRHKCTKYDA